MGRQGVRNRDGGGGGVPGSAEPDLSRPPRERRQHYLGPFAAAWAIFVKVGWQSFHLFVVQPQSHLFTERGPQIPNSAILR